MSVLPDPPRPANPLARIILSIVQRGQLDRVIVAGLELQGMARCLVPGRRQRARDELALLGDVTGAMVNRRIRERSVEVWRGWPLLWPRVQVRGREHLDRAVATGRGVQTISTHAPHAFVILAVEPRYRGATVVEWLDIYSVLRFPPHWRLLRRGSNLTAEVRAMLGRGEVIDRKIDQWGSARATILGREVSFPAGPANDAWATGSLIVAYRIVRPQWRLPEIHFEPAIDPWNFSSLAALQEYFVSVAAEAHGNFVVANEVSLSWLAGESDPGRAGALGGEQATSLNRVTH